MSQIQYSTYPSRIPNPALVCLWRLHEWNVATRIRLNAMDYSLRPYSSLIIITHLFNNDIHLTKSIFHKAIIILMNRELANLFVIIVGHFLFILFYSVQSWKKIMMDMHTQHKTGCSSLCWAQETLWCVHSFPLFWWQFTSH